MIEKAYKKYSNELQKYLYKRTNNIAIAEEIMQETFLRAWTHQHTLKNSKSIRPWLYKITNNELYSYYKKNQERTYEIESVTTETPESILINNELEEIIDKSIQQLNPRYQQQINFIQDGLNYQEQSTITGQSVIIHKLLKTRSLSQLKKILEEYLPQIQQIKRFHKTW